MINIDLDAIIKEHHKEIVNKTYIWKNEEITAIYKFVTDFLNKRNEDIKQREDLTQELVFFFIDRVIPKFNVRKGIKISTYANKAFANYCLDGVSRKNREINKHTVSLQTPIGANLILEDVIEDPSKLEYLDEKLDKDGLINRLKEMFKDDSIMCDYYFSGIRYTMEDLGKKYNKSKMAICKHIKRRVKKASEDKILKSLI